MTQNPQFIIYYTLFSHSLYIAKACNACLLTTVFFNSGNCNQPMEMAGKRIEIMRVLKRVESIWLEIKGFVIKEENLQVRK